MPIKFNHYWTIIPTKIEGYKKFMIKEFIPGLNGMGIHTVAGWRVLVGGYSEIIFETVSQDLDLLEKALRNPKYRELNTKLLNFVRDYKTKVLVTTGKKDSYSMDIKEGTVKFNQMWEIIGDRKKEYDRYSLDEFFPCLEELGISVSREWLVLIGDGPHIICEGRANDVSNLINNLQSERFRKATRQLKEYVQNYTSRILTFHIQKVKGYKSESYKIISD